MRSSEHAEEQVSMKQHDLDTLHQGVSVLLTLPVPLPLMLPLLMPVLVLLPPRTPSSAANTAADPNSNSSSTGNGGTCVHDNKTADMSCTTNLACLGSLHGRAHTASP